MHPGTHVWPHTGPTNCRLRMHLGLVIPKEGCRIRCAQENRYGWGFCLFCGGFFSTFLKAEKEVGLHVIKKKKGVFYSSGGVMYFVKQAIYTPTLGTNI